MIDVNYEHPDGRFERVRKVSPVQTRRGAEQHERNLRQALLEGRYGKKEEEKKQVPTLVAHKPLVMDWYAANKRKPSGIEGIESVYRNHLLPLFGKRSLDSFRAVDEDELKAHFGEKSASLYNNTASALNVALKVAVRWRLIDQVPHRFGLLKRQDARPRFYDFDEYEKLVEVALKLDARIHLVVLLGGEAGLRRGEIIGLERADVDTRRRQLTVVRSVWKGKTTDTKGLRYRVIPLTHRLSDALVAHRHLRGNRVLYADNGEPVTAKVLQKWMAKAQQLAGLRSKGAMHILRHTFCSHLAMRGAPPISIQQLAGHDDLATTLRYMHLAPGETTRAIALLEERGHGNLTATNSGETKKAAN
jgi:integrase